MSEGDVSQCTSMDQQITQADTSCPRCGYDLRGTIETWKHECPINGVCTECGLEFEWGELLCNRRNMPRWCVEYSQGWGIPIAAIKTLLVMLWPRKFWRDLKMVHKPRWRRLLALALPVLLLLYLAFALSVGHLTYKQFKKLNQDYISTPFHPEAYGLYATINPFSEYQLTYTRTTVLTSMTQTTISPRGYANWIAKSQRPSLFWQEVYMQIRNNSFTPFRGRRMRMSVVIVQGLMLVALCPLAFMALSQSLRKAKVRWQHLVRIALYSWPIIVPPLGLYMRNWNGGWNFPWWLPQWLIPCSLIYVLTGMILWWSLAAKHYLKLPHAWGVGISMVVLAYAGGLFLVSLIDFVMI